jgi:hypothetical protein
MTATKFGYHVMFYSAVLDVDYGYDNLSDYLTSLYGAKDWSAELSNMLENYEDYNTESYLYILFNNLTSKAVTKAVADNETKVVNKYIYDKDNTYVKLNKSAYADLVG